ncbi:hypothetical protein AZH53_03490 [Methanomicrobiaceae archaeon CYW5]|uniref:CBS domain-containing protein n=1 Tax=Methanovulcanius yangii TaxID=1789227 RepID=UPI0029CA5E2D|nr:CBS domain-containing protein [Methanovulcanius yangii]MBT8507490.1 hypothetical protein [Methanovulcanius yangii]
MKVVSDLMRTLPPLKSGDPITKARQMLRDGDFRELYIQDDAGTIAGIIDISDVLMVSDTRSNLTLASLMRPAPVVGEDVSVEEALLVIRDARTDSAGVVRPDGELLGAVLLSDLFPIVMSRQNPTGIIEDYMTKRVVTCGEDEFLYRVYAMITESGYDGLPVIRGKGREIVGIISRRDLLQGHIKNSITSRHRTPVQMIMVTPPIIAFRGDTVRDAAEAMIKHDISRLPVIEPDGTVIGIISRQDILRALSLPGEYE